MDLRRKMFDRLMKYPIKYFQENSLGYILSRQIDDIEDTEGAFLYNILSFILYLLEVLVFLFFMFKINSILTIVCIFIIIGNISLNFMFPIKQMYKKHNEKKATILMELQDCVAGIRVIKSMHAQEYESNKFGNILNNYYKIRRKRDVMDIDRRNLSAVIKGFSNPLIIILGGFFIVKNYMTIGSVMAFTIYFSKLDSLLNPLINFIPLFKVAEIAIERISQNLLSQVESDNADSELKIQDGGIEFKNIQLSYGTNRKILDNISFKIKPGSKVAFVGPSGGGKSSIVSLLLRFFNYESGDILIDNTSVMDYSLKEVRNSIGIVQQENFLFNRTLKENIVFNKAYKIEDINEALESTFSNVIVNNFSLGIDTPITDRGNNLSCGEKQRLCITREILKKPKILILDEATSALDTISEEIVQKSIDNIADDKTIIIIAHRLSTIKKVDCIYVVDEGKIVEAGKHDELMKNKGVYYSLINSQDNKSL
jgi:ABC-type multidrug transport system, ATPase and permease components